MRSEAIWLTVSLLALGCATSQPPVAAPDAAPAAEAAAAPEPVPPPEAAAATEAPPAPEAAATPVAAAAPADRDPGDRWAQCEAGGARACLALCNEQAAVCDKKREEYDKSDCNDAAKEIDPCPERAGDMRLGRLCTVHPSALSPTQAAVGMFAVTCKSSGLEAKEDDSKKKLRRYLMARPVPVVVGSGGGLYLTDRHHLSTAMSRSDIDEENQRLFVCPMVNRIDQAPAPFWSYMENNNFTWLHDRRGERIDPGDLPGGLAELDDDPYRTLSRWLRESCGYIKCGKVCGGDDSGGADTSDLARCKESPVSAYFLEFHWANYLRQAVAIPDIYELPLADQAAALRANLDPAMSSARRQEALDLGLPGWNHGLIQAQQIEFDSAGCEK